MDPFEARLQFIRILQRLNASNEANENALQFLLQNPDLMEDLYSCTLEELDKSSLNIRLNILNFLEMIICECNARYATQFQYWIGRDLDKIVNKVIPDTLLGLVNLGPTRASTASIFARSKVNIDSRTREKVEIILTLRKEKLNLPLPENYSLSISRDSKSTSNQQQHRSGNSSLANPDSGRPHTDENNMATTSSPNTMNNSFELSRTDILRRMDEDRERSKRLKEDIWAIDYQKDGPFSELNSEWKAYQGLDELDYEQMNEDNEIVLASVNSSVITIV